MRTDEGINQDVGGIGLIYIEPLDVRLLSYRYLALSKTMTPSSSQLTKSLREGKTQALSSSSRKG